MASMKVFHYAGCSTCRKARKWLDGQGLDYELVDIVEAPPSARTLQAALKRSGLPLKKFFNTSGQSYRSGGFKERLPEMSEAEAIAALVADGKLIKRPLLLTDDAVLVGFNEKAWADALT